MSTTESTDNPAPLAVPGPPPPAERPAEDDLAPATDATVDLERAVLPTIVSPLVAWSVIVAFCVMLFVVPAVQIFLEATGRSKPQLLNLFKQQPTRENLHQYEQDVAANSAFKEFVQPRLQLALSQSVGFGNTKVYIGRDGVLFYRPGLDFVTGRGILDPGRIRARRRHLIDAGERSAEPDPRPAIFAFNKACQEAGAHLLLVPVPDKVSVMPMAAGIAPSLATSVPTNVDFPRFLAELREAGVDVYDPLTLVSSAGASDRYLKQDTHWTPEWMETVVEGIAGHVRAAQTLPSRGPALYDYKEVAIRRVGDLVDMLSLPNNQTLFPPQEVTIRRTIDVKTGEPAGAPSSADVLLLGDSFANIYTAPQMGWGDAAGLGPTLARHLNREVEAITINGKGATGTRAELARRPEGLSGKRLVIWEFAVRELTDASWEVIRPGDQGAESDGAQTQQSRAAGQPAVGAGLLIDATIEAVSKVPEPNSVPYPDCLNYTLLHVDRVVEGKYTDDKILAVFWAMKKNVWLPPAKYAPGRHVRVKLIPMKEAEESVRSGQRADDIADYTHRPWFVTEELKP
jgi:alginate O-acetyltransferase complex protein AlgJ